MVPPEKLYHPNAITRNVISPEMLPHQNLVDLCKSEPMRNGAANWGKMQCEGIEGRDFTFHFWFRKPYFSFCQLYFSCSRSAFFNSFQTHLKCNLRETKMRVCERDFTLHSTFADSPSTSATSPAYRPWLRKWSLSLSRHICPVS